MTTTLLFIRHGQTDYNAARRWQGHLDIPLNEIGRSQSQALAERIASWPVQAIYSSDLRRAAMTAQILASTLNLEPILDPSWRERDVGVFAGLTNSEVRRDFPEAWAKMQQGIIDPPGGEHHRDFHRRLTGAFRWLVDRHKDETVVVVSHGGAIQVVIADVLGFSENSRGHFSLRGNTGLSIIEATEAGSTLTLLNDTGHLESSGTRSW